MRERLQTKGRDSVAYTVRKMVTESTDRIWMYEDFVGLEAGAVSQALSRLAKEGIIRRIRKGAYYRPRQTIVGESKAPSNLPGVRIKINRPVVGEEISAHETAILELLLTEVKPANFRQRKLFAGSYR